MNTTIELAGFTLTAVEIQNIEADVVQSIKEDISIGCLVSFEKNHCLENSILFAQQMKGNGITKEIVEGLVMNDNGLTYWHYWNRFKWSDIVLDNDVTLTVIASDEERDTPKTYYELQSYPLGQIHNIRASFRDGYSEDLHTVIDYYYQVNPEQKEQYDKLNNLFL
jgi:hypothetical protein